MDPHSAQVLAGFHRADLATEAARSRLAAAARHGDVLTPLERVRALETIPRQRVPAVMSGSRLE